MSTVPIPSAVADRVLPTEVFSDRRSVMALDPNVPRDGQRECPRCGQAAQVVDRFYLNGSPYPVEHVKLVCADRHSSTLPLDMTKSLG